MTVFNMHDAKTQLSNLVARAEAGEEIIIARRNKPAVRLVVAEAASPGGFGEDKQAGYDVGGLDAAMKAGREFTIMQDGKAVATVTPVKSKQPRVPGRFAHLRGKMPPEAFYEPLSDDELDAWEGKYSNDGKW